MTHETPDAVSGAFYELKEIGGERVATWQIILGIRRTEDTLLEKVRIVIPIATEDNLEPGAARAGLLSTLLEDPEWGGELKRWSNEMSSLTVEELGEWLKARFAFSLEGGLCLRGEVEINLQEDGEDLHLIVQDGDSEGALRERVAFGELSSVEKDFVERGKAVWGGYTYDQMSPLVRPENVDVPPPVKACPKK